MSYDDFRQIYREWEGEREREREAKFPASYLMREQERLSSPLSSRIRELQGD